MSEILYDVAKVIELEMKNKMTDEGYEELASYLLRSNIKGKKTIEEMDEVMVSLKEPPPGTMGNTCSWCGNMTSRR